MKKIFLKPILIFILLFPSIYIFCQNTLSGKIIDNNKEAVIGASLKINKLSLASSTNLDGEFSISNVPNGSHDLVISAVGYKTLSQSITINSNLELNFTIYEDVKLLDEAVVIGYGTARTKDLTGSAVAVSEDKFLKGSLATPEQLIMGKVPGLKVTSNDGAPGSGSTMRIRGGTSINASNDPLIVIDGVPIDNGGIAGAANPLSLINPNDIESFVVLKDASACAIYGSRAANGVIIITTKKGQDKFSVTVSQKTSLSTIAKYADVLSGDSLWSLIQSNGDPDQIALLGDSNYNTDWQREVFRNAVVNDFNIAVSGKAYRFSYGNRIDNGILKRDRFVRNNISLNLNPSFLDDHFFIESNNKLVQTNSNFSDRGALGAAYFDPTKPVFSSDTSYGGYYEWLQNDGSPNTLSARNPVGLINQKNDVSKVQRYIGNTKLTYKTHFLPELKLVYNAGLDISEGSGTVELESSSAAGYFNEGSFNSYKSFKRNVLSESYFNYNNSKEDKLSYLDITGGFSFQHWKSRSPNLPVYNQLQDSIISPAAEFPFFTENALMSFYARSIYNLNGKYVFNFALRRDGSSRFSPQSRWGWFPSASAAWLVNEENFMQSFENINLLKIRFGYGVTGQQDGIGDYGYISNYYQGNSTAQYIFGDSAYFVFRPNGFDGNLKWEETESFNLGIDYGFFNDKYSGSIDFYQKNTSDLLAAVLVPVGTNFSPSILSNVGGMTNRGVEFNFNTNLSINKEINLFVNLNAAYNLNKVTKINTIDDSTFLNLFEDSSIVDYGIQVGSIGFNNFVQMHNVGYPTFSFLLYEQLYSNGNLIQVGQQADIDINDDGVIDQLDLWRPIDAYKDMDSNQVINQNDLYFANNAAPALTLGAALNLSYKNWYAGISMRAEFGGYIYNSIHSISSTYYATGDKDFINNINNIYYQHEVQTSDQYQRLSDAYLEKANFFRMDFLNIGYNFQNPSFLPLNNLDVSFSIQNVFLLTKYSGLDPELGGGIDNNIYPRPRVFSLNLNFNF